MYSKTVWQDLPSTQTPITAGRLNNMENGIEENDTAIGKEWYSSVSTYAVGDYCIYNNILYRCKTAITTAESFNSSKWEATSILNEINNFFPQISVQNTLYNKWVRIAHFQGAVTGTIYVSIHTGANELQLKFDFASLGFNGIIQNIIAVNTNSPYFSKIRIVRKGHAECYLELFANVNDVPKNVSLCLLNPTSILKRRFIRFL